MSDIGLDFTGFLLAALAGLLAPPLLLAALWRTARRRAAPGRAARVAACAALALLGTLLIAAVIGSVWKEDEAVGAAAFVAPTSLAFAAAIVLRTRLGWALPPLGLLVSALVFAWATS